MAAPEQPRPDESNPRRAPRPHRLPALPLVARIIVLVVGWVVLLIGVAGLFLPGLQGILTIAAGAALLSLASKTIYDWLRKLLQRWPKVWNRVESFRAWAHAKLTPTGRRADHTSSDDSEQ